MEETCSICGVELLDEESELCSSCELKYDVDNESPYRSKIPKRKREN